MTQRRKYLLVCLLGALLSAAVMYGCGKTEDTEETTGEIVGSLS